VTTNTSKGRTQIIDLRREVFPNAMHDHQRIACSSVIKLLQNLVEDIVIALHGRLGFGGEQILEQPRPLKETDKFVNINVTTKSAYGISGSHNT